MTKNTITTIVLLICTISVALSNSVNFSIVDYPKEIRTNQPFEITAKFTIPKGVHIYPQETQIGMPTKIELDMPSEIRLESIQFPPTSKFTFMGMTADGYSEDFNIRIKCTTSSVSKTSKKAITIIASWLECSDTCVPAKVKQTLNVQVNANSTSSNNLWKAILGAILGGLILNIMPCVFPVISLKIMSFASEANEPKASIVAKSLIFSMGIILSFAILSFALVGAKYLGSSVGWGFQLQSPIFTKVMMIVFWLITLNFAGVWEFGNSISAVASGIQTNKANKWVSAFSSGVLAVLVASPCVAPFMASAVGYALTGNASTTESIAIITSVGIGMAIPYIILAQFPSLIKKLPRPGKWLEILKKALSIPMLITVVWLAWVMNNQGSSIYDIVIILMIFFFVAVIWGKFANPMQNKKYRIMAVVSCFALSVLTFFVNFNFFEDKNSKTNTTLKSTWTPQEVQKLLGQGKNVFVDFTASWCLTCQYNKKIIFSEKTKKLFKEKNVEILVADWTNKNDTITEELKKYNRAGVPLYLLFSAKDKNNPQILPSILTTSILSEAVDKIKQ